MIPEKLGKVLCLSVLMGLKLMGIILSLRHWKMGQMLLVQNIQVPKGVTVVKAKDTRYGLACSSKFWHYPSKKFNLVELLEQGKTTSTYMVKSILEAYGHKTGLIGTISNKIGEETLPQIEPLPRAVICNF